ncbi:FadR/GntR family transcriptional regulator [Streptomyces phaeochromogenes]|uniref:FadR/GntR family transcriptional regulator n=1 Tax=Streptomyces phaeochromogenes TaxID=1923 RepID=UPI0036B4B3DC
MPVPHSKRSDPGDREGNGNRRVFETVADEIRGMIANGQLPVGQALPSETALMEAFQIARPTMREVLRVLESDGLVEVRRGVNGGPVVSSMPLAPVARLVGVHLQARGVTLHDLKDAQSVIEPGAARLASQARSEEDIVQLRELVTEVESCTHIEEFGVLAARFHLLIMKVSGNTTLAMIGELLSTLLPDSYVASLKGTRDGVVRAVIKSAAVWYSQLVDAIEAGDGDAAEQLWARHQHMARFQGAAISGRPELYRLYPRTDRPALVRE